MLRPMNPRRSAFVAASLLALAGAGVSTAANASAPPDSTPPQDATDRDVSDSAEISSSGTFEPDPVDWTEIFPGVEEGYLTVPIDYDNPSNGTFQIYVTRHLATGTKVGSLLVNPGGPGFGGSDFGIYADQIYNQSLLDSFDIIGFDPRGTGASEPAIDCVDDYDRYFASTDITPDDDAERQQIIDLAQEFADSCAQKNADIIQFVGTNNAARDMDSIRRSLGEDTISYFGFSYGSELGATWATLFPETVRAAVLDGAADPNADLLEGALQQTAGFEGTLTTYLAQCSAAPTCEFNNDGDAEGAFDQLMLKLDEKPIPSVAGRPDITRSVALQGTAEAMYSDSSWPELSSALAAAQQGDGSGLLALYDSYYQRQFDGTWDNSLEAFQAISCMDTEERATIEEEDAEAQLFQAIAPRFAPGTTGSYFCTFFPASTDPRVAITGADAGPIVVCGATGDAATPLASTRNMAAALEDGRLIVIEADQHTCYGASPCADQAINDYLVDLTIPDEETDCPA